MDNGVSQAAMSAADGRNVSNSDDLECPVCLDTFRVPISQCVVGHSFCTDCIKPHNITQCPECRSAISDVRNYALEKLINSMDVRCSFQSAGCKFVLQQKDRAQHERECKFRVFRCEGAQFCGWSCSWRGSDVLGHFRDKHAENARLEHAAVITLPYNEGGDFRDVHLVSAHHNLFWYKYRVDAATRRALWAFQYVGQRARAADYYYEFEIYERSDPVRKFKVTEYCCSDLDDVDQVFQSEHNVSISLAALRTYVDATNHFCCRFRIMKVRKEQTKAHTAHTQPAPHARYLSPAPRVPHAQCVSRAPHVPHVPRAPHPPHVPRAPHPTYLPCAPHPLHVPRAQSAPRLPRMPRRI